MLRNHNPLTKGEILPLRGGSLKIGGMSTTPKGGVGSGDDTPMQEVVPQCSINWGAKIDIGTKGTAYTTDVDMSDMEGIVGKLKEVFEGPSDKDNAGITTQEKASPLLRDPKLPLEIASLEKDTHQG